ncbi:hypothetical protein IMZ11_34470 [Microtetraspora sp. AC03309]|uniref:hypothetical protein n=1 Tax=Microtetraspora sp. AC03309 TaxID=2779376 RepID=UPI001E42749F|nr:hypothetical protein [Microtetraspora sp. AC03309]MCC5580735.1 hypothetical protein [Microtetraspora sp. AC03309]
MAVTSVLGQRGAALFAVAGYQMILLVAAAPGVISVLYGLARPVAHRTRQAGRSALSPVCSP